jgi:signal transduction histidine kinase
MNPPFPHSRILIVDDVAKNIQVVASILKEQGFDMSFARSGKAALTLIASEPFDLILLDIMMPEMDGLEVCRQLKENPQTLEIPVIFLTAKTDAESILKGFEIGAADYVTKPFHAPELIARVKTHLRLKHTHDQLWEANATKDKFFSIVSHDLRSAFNSLIVGSGMILDYYEDFDRNMIKSYVQDLNVCSKTTYNLLQNLLSWANAQTGRMICRPQNIYLDEIVKESIGLLSKTAQEKDIRLVNKVDPKLSAFADIQMITTVIRNLISNALKFTGPGGEIRIDTADIGNAVEISVSDTGVGIPEEEMPLLFRIDVKYSKRGTAHEEGTGLGLILCREFVEKNGGKIRAESRAGKGSRFSFTLPRPPSVPQF